MTEINGRLVYQHIDQLTKSKKISIKKLSEKVGFNSPSTIYNYKYGKKPSKASLNAIARALNTTPEYLRGETDNWKKVKENDSSKDNYVADLDSPVYALNGQRITGDLAKDIRDYARFKLSQTKKDNKRDE